MCFLLVGCVAWSGVMCRGRWCVVGVVSVVRAGVVWAWAWAGWWCGVGGVSVGVGVGAGVVLGWFEVVVCCDVGVGVVWRSVGVVPRFVG